MPRPLGISSLRILAALRDGSRYGLDLVAHTGLPSGTVYPTLGRLTRRGMVASKWEDQRIAEREGRPRRRYHQLTPARNMTMVPPMPSSRAVPRSGCLRTSTIGSTIMASGGRTQSGWLTRSGSSAA